jgi:hypothetical protein
VARLLVSHASSLYPKNGPLSMDEVAFPWCHGCAQLIRARTSPAMRGTRPWHQTQWRISMFRCDRKIMAVLMGCRSIMYHVCGPGYKSFLLVVCPPTDAFTARELSFRERHSEPSSCRGGRRPPGLEHTSSVMSRKYLKYPAAGASPRVPTSQRATSFVIASAAKHSPTFKRGDCFVPRITSGVLAMTG